MFQFSFLSDVFNLYYLLPNDLVGPTGDTVRETVARCLTAYNGQPIILT